MTYPYIVQAPTIKAPKRPRLAPYVTGLVDHTTHLFRKSGRNWAMLCDDSTIVTTKPSGINQTKCRLCRIVAADEQEWEV